MSGESRVVYEEEQTAVRKICKENCFAVSFDERYPYAVVYRADPPITLLDGQENDTPNKEILQLDVVIGADVAVTIKGSGTLLAAVLRKLIKSAENCADAFFRARAEETAND